MMEDFATREWADNQHRFSEDVERGLRNLWRGFQRLNAAQFDAPWERKAERCKLAR